jgi:hypothetical protein
MFNKIHNCVEVLQLFNHKDIQPQHDFFAHRKNRPARLLTSARLCRLAYLIIYQAYNGPYSQITRHMIKTAPAWRFKGLASRTMQRP